MEKENLLDHYQYLGMIKDVFNLGTKASEAIDYARSLIKEEICEMEKKLHESHMQVVKDKKLDKYLAGH